MLHVFWIIKPLLNAKCIKDNMFKFIEITIHVTSAQTFQY